MKLSVSIWSVHEKVYSKQMNNIDFISFCHDNNVKYVELLDNFLSVKEIKEVKANLKERKMEVSSYSINNDFVQSQKADREKQVNYIKESIDIACDLGAKYIRVFSGEEKEGIAFEDAKQWIIDGFKAVAPYAEENGITLVIENHGLFVGKSSQVKALIDAVNSPNFKSNADVANFLLADEKSLDAVKNLKDHIGFVHFKDFKQVPSGKNGYRSLSGKMYEGTILGKGEVPLKEIVEFLHANRYDGFLSIEYEGTGDPIAETEESIKYARSIIL
ncbi:sugar phosphate isomerase/epimerase family protein [Athalassotoga sp.]|uniref:sugar phosphate isomerase/epimerase family protein n=1 Tax=Athalassotoga sp. TaxID=2022597 RepID=UPI003D0249EC